MSDLKYVGKSIPIHDAREKVSGKIKYAGDMKIPGMLYAKLLLSRIAHGRIKRINTTKAEALEGVVKVFTYDNSPKICYNSHQWFVGMEITKDEQLFTNHVKYVGDRIGAVVAKDKNTAERALELIQVEYEELPAVVDPHRAFELENYYIGKKVLESGDVDHVFRESVITVEDRVQTSKVHHGAMETHACVAAPEPSGDINIWTPCQVVFQVRLLAAEVLEMPLNRVRVIKASMGGSFGGKGQPILEPVCAYLARETNAPVMLQMDRTESIIGTRTRTATHGTVQTAVGEDGTILGRKLHMLVDTGAYLTNGEAVTVAMAKKAFRLYRMNHQRFIGELVYTNTPIGGACRGYGSPQIHALSEINMDNVARKLGMDPVQLRLKNLVHPFDKDPTNGPDLGNARAIDCVKEGMKVFNWKEKWLRSKTSDRIVRGVGMACATHGNGYHGGYQDFVSMSLRMTEDGGILLNSGIHDLGCGTVTTMKQIVGEVLDVETEKILVPEGDTKFSPFDVAGTQASRVTFVCGSCALKIAEQAKGKFIKYVSKILNCSIDQVKMASGMVWVRDQEKYSYGKMINLIHARFQDDISVSYTYTSPANPAVYVVNFVEVEIDTFTGLVKVLDVLAVHDIGKAINPGFVEGQIQGAIQMGIGFALTEEIKIDNKGKISGDRFSKYHVINAPSMPPVKVLLIEDGEEHGPFGAKSVGEISTCAIAPAIVNAINHALDINITSLPVTPEKIIEALKKQ